MLYLKIFRKQLAILLLNIDFFHRAKEVESENFISVVSTSETSCDYISYQAKKALGFLQMYMSVIL